MNKDVVFEVKDLVSLLADSELDGVSSYADDRILASVIKEKIETYISELDTYIKENADEKTTWESKEYKKILEIGFKKTSTLDPKIVDELSDEECRKGYTVTEKAIKLSGRNDLIAKYKTITESKALTLKSMKD